jgi:hypothetical protein
LAHWRGSWRAEKWVRIERGTGWDMVASGHEALHESYFLPRRNLPHH